MKRNQWQRRLLSCFLAVVVLLGGLLCCLPVRAGAIVPLGLVQSALASYVTSTGYKMYNDQGTGEDILGSLGELYNDYVTISNQTITGQLVNLAFLANSSLISQDSSGHIVVSKAAADIFQDFSDWLQTEYSIPDNTEEPTQVVAAQSGSLYSDGQGHVCRRYVCNGPQSATFHGYTYYICPFPIVGEGPTIESDFRFCSRSYNSVFYLTQYDGRIYMLSTNFNGRYCIALSSNTNYELSDPYHTSQITHQNSWSNSTLDSHLNYSWIPVSSSAPNGTSIDSYTAEASIPGLALSIAQSVVDRAKDLSDDESLVVAVGAGVGATAEDITAIVAQGVKAQTLDPSVTVVADAVIDTPVQPYPDIDGLGLPTLGAALVSRFPFCVPWDFVDTLRILNAAPIPPVFDVTLVPASVAARWGVSGNYTLHVDLTSQEYAKLFVALRWGTLVGFCLGLALLTKRLIWTA